MTATLERPWKPYPGFKPLCSRGIHEDIPENEYRQKDGPRRCRPCRQEYMRKRRRGLRWVSNREKIVPETGPLTPEEAARLRAQVACLRCGATPARRPDGKVRTEHAETCPVPHIREGGGS